MRIWGLLGAAIALSGLTPIAPARADTSPGDLMYTDLFRWSNWREILAKFDCTEELTFYLWNAPSPQSPIVVPPSPASDSAVTAPSGGAVEPPDPVGPPGGDAPSGAPTGPVDPIGTPGIPGGETPGGAMAVPEVSTWTLLLLGFAGLAYAGFRRGKGRLSDKRLRTPA